MMRDPRYRHEAPAIEHNFQAPASIGLPAQLQLECHPGGTSQPDRALILWGCFDAEIAWGGRPRAAEDELISPPGWTVTEPGWHPQTTGQPRPARRPLPAETGVIKW
ncbi:MAG: hypothetical protein K0Q72_3055 [Armatimonadetes bacterium]|jgi:hypothetical protein|nr:hypothetical protein [Armatimonadota bacterium]